LKGGRCGRAGRGRVGKWEPALVPELEEQRLGESKSQLEVFFFLFFKWKQDYGTLSPTEGIFHLLLSDWVLVIYMLS
jgi:hypothetical protein